VLIGRAAQAGLASEGGGTAVSAFLFLLVL